eukprot:scaffold41711_cov81-Cyclotella_meneghiniana.AAC.1
MERAPLSMSEANETERPFVPYSDRPPTSSSERDADDEDAYHDNRNIVSSRVIQIDDEPASRECDYQDTPSYEDEYGDSPYSNPTLGVSTERHYRTSLICAYIRHYLDGRLIRLLFLMAVMLIMMFCASAIGYIISQDGNPFEDGNLSVSDASDNFIPPSPNLHYICNDWVTMSGRKKCQSYCDNAKCCSIPESNEGSCMIDHMDDCAVYRSACMALELHSSVSKSIAENNETQITVSGIGSLQSFVDLQPAPSNLKDICSASSLSTPEGFTRCSDLCRPSRCCNPNTYDCQLYDKSSLSNCAQYKGPCKSVAETWRGSGQGESGLGNEISVANEVMSKCNSAK